MRIHVKFGTLLEYLHINSAAAWPLQTGNSMEEIHLLTFLTIYFTYNSVKTAIKDYGFVYSYMFWLNWVIFRLWLEPHVFTRYSHTFWDTKKAYTCFRKGYLIVYNCNFAKYNGVLYILTTILGFLLVIWFRVLWRTYCAPIFAGMCPTSVRLVFSAYGEQCSFTWVGPRFKVIYHRTTTIIVLNVMPCSLDTTFQRNRLPSQPK